MTDEPVSDMKIRDRLRRFMKQYNMTRRGMCEVLGFPKSTLDDYLDFGHTPPGCLPVLLTLMEEHYQVRTWLRVNENSRKPKPRGRPWPKNNPFCYGSDTREAALEKARMRQ